jgi:hypothetical protein
VGSSEISEEHSGAERDQLSKHSGRVPNSVYLSASGLYFGPQKAPL